MQNRERRPKPCICQAYCNIGERAKNTASSSKRFRSIDDAPSKLKIRDDKQLSFKCCGCKESGIGHRYECIDCKHSSHLECWKSVDCKGCKGSGIGDRYQSTACPHSFHPDCVYYLEDATATHRFLKGSTFRFYESRVDNIDKICDACGRYIKGSSYHCKDTRKDLHPSCLNLEETYRHGVIRYQLCEKLTSECFLCHAEKDDFFNQFWGYSTEDGKHQVHVSCRMDRQVKQADAGIEKKAECVIL